jgi:hypothetical protein
MENTSDKSVATFLESVIADENATPEKRKWAEDHLHEFHQLMEDQGKLFSFTKVIQECDPESREPLLQKRDDLFHQIAYQYYYLLKTVDPENETIYKDDYESVVKDYDRNYGLKSR